ncbi:MAG: HEAT repeat domain-containing protein [Planctomycetota bacterium]
MSKYRWVISLSIVLLLFTIFFIWVVPFKDFISVFSNAPKSASVTTATAQSKNNAEGESFLSNLRKGLKDKDADERIQSLRWLSGFINDKESIPEIRLIFERDDEKVRKTAAVALAYLDDKESFAKIAPELRKMLGEEDDDLRRAAITALARIDIKDSIPKIRHCLYDKSERVRCAAVEALANLNDRESLPVITGLLDNEAKPVKKAAVESYIKLHGQDNIAEIKKLLDYKDKVVPQWTIYRIDQWDIKVSATDIMRFLDADDILTRWSAASLMGKLSGREFIPKLKEMLLKDKDSTVRGWATVALIELGEKQDLTPKEGQYIARTRG